MQQPEDKLLAEALGRINRGGKIASRFLKNEISEFDRELQPRTGHGRRTRPRFLGISGMSSTRSTWRSSRPATADSIDHQTPSSDAKAST